MPIVLVTSRTSSIQHYDVHVSLLDEESARTRSALYVDGYIKRTDNVKKTHSKQKQTIVTTERKNER